MSIRLFVSYSHVDDALRHQLEVHLAPLKKSGRISVWHDRRIAAGEDWADQISENLESADIILALISPEFIDSEYCWGVELTRAIDRHAEGLARLIPVILRPCDWLHTPLNRLQALPRGGEPVTTWDDLDEAFLDVARGVGVALDELTTHPTAPLRERIYVNLPNTGQKLFGREAELASLDAAWEKSGKQRIVSLVAAGGVGKTALVKTWLDRLSREDYRDAQRVFAWSFYLQGTDSKEVSADPFLERALAFFGDSAPAGRDSSHDRGLRLAQLARKGKNLLILDGLEPLQHPPGAMEGRLKDPALEALLRQLSAGNRGLCVVTTRIPIPEIEFLPDSRMELDRLTPEAGARLLEHLGVKGTPQQLREASREFEGHALALTLLGTYLAELFGGNVNKRKDIPPPGRGDPQGRHAIRVMQSYEDWLADKPEQLALLRMLGLFHRPASRAEIRALLEDEPEIPGLPNLAVSVKSPTDWQRLVWNVRETRLLAERSSRDATELDAHPLVRDYFGNRFHKQFPEGWKEGHRRLYEYHRRVVVAKRGTPENYRPEDFHQMLAAVIHGCRAGRHGESLDKVYRDLIIQNHHSFHKRLFPVPSALLTGISELFENRWTSPVADLTPSQGAFVLEEVGHCLLLVGRLTEAIAPLEAGIVAREALGEHDLASKYARLTREAYLMLGDLEPALEYAQRSVELAARNSNPTVLRRQRSGLGQVLHWMGRCDAARAEFLAAEEDLQARSHESSVLYSYYGFWYCELLLDVGEAAANGRMSDLSTSWAGGKGGTSPLDTALALIGETRQRARKSIQVAEEEGWVIDLALDHLTIGRSAVLEAIFTEAKDLTEATQCIDTAFIGLQQAGEKHYLARGFLGRAALRRYRGDLGGAETDAGEALEIAQSCNMLPFEVDAMLEKCNQELIRATRESRARAEGCLERARAIVTKTGYLRRQVQIEMLESILMSSGRISTSALPLALRCLECPP